MFQRLARGALALSVASVTAVGVLVASAPPAAAAVTPAPADLVKVGEAVKGMGPGVAARNASKATKLIPGPVGGALRVISLGFSAFNTSDYWLPFVAGAMDSDPETVAAAGPVGYVNGCTGVDTGVATATNGISVSCSVTYTQALGGTSMWRIDLTCVNPNGSTYTQTVGPAGMSAPNAGTTTPTVRTLTPSIGSRCAGGVAGAKIRDFRLDLTLSAGNNVGTWEYSMASQSEEVVTTVTCERPDGTTYQVQRTTTRSDTVQVDGTEWAQVPACAPGDTPTNLNVSSTDNGVTTTRGDYPLGNDAEHDQQYPLCAGQACYYRVFVDGNPCVSGVEACTHWSYIWSTQQHRVECFYGPYSVAVTHCAFMERAYDTATGSKTGTVPNTDGDPDTYTPPAPAPPRTTPTASPSPTSSSSSSSSPSTSASPPPVGEPSTEPPNDPAGARCFPSGWGWLNPFEWVYKPVMCAMRDAFVPNKDLTVQRVDSLRSQVAVAGPGPAITQVSSLLTPAGSAGGCSGPPVTFAVSGVSETMHPFSACDEPMSTAAFYVKALATVSITIGGALAIVRAIGAGFGFTFTMGRGAGDGD